MLADHAVRVVIAVEDAYKWCLAYIESWIHQSVELHVVLSHVVAISHFITAHWSGDGAVVAVLNLTSAIDALIFGHIQPVVLGADLAYLRVVIANITLLDLARQIVALLIPLVEIITWFALVTIVDS